MATGLPVWSLPTWAWKQVFPKKSRRQLGQRWVALRARGYAAWKSGHSWSWFHDHPPKKADPLAEPPSRDAQGYPKRGVDIPGPPPRRKEDRPLTDYEKQLLREIQELKNRQEMMVAPAPPPLKYSDSVENWQKGLESVVYDGLF